MSVVVCKSYDNKQLNKFSTVVGHGIVKMNRSLLGCCLVVFMLYRIRVHFLSFFMHTYYDIVCRPTLLLSLWAYSIYHNNSPVCVHSNSQLYEVSLVYKRSVCGGMKLIRNFLLLSRSTYASAYWFYVCSYNKVSLFSLPSKRTKETVLRSSHGNKKSREQFSSILYRMGVRYPSFLATRSGYLLRKIVFSPPGASLCNKYALSYQG